MEKNYYQNWNKMIYCVSDVYLATKKLKTAKSMDLGGIIRKTAISITVKLNQEEWLEKSNVYPILSSVFVLETYLEIARRDKVIKDTALLQENLSELKETLNSFL